MNDFITKGDMISILCISMIVGFLTYFISGWYFERKAKRTNQEKEEDGLPNIYNKFNRERIEAYQKLSEDYKLEEGTIREIFCKGADWYKKLVEDNDK